MSKLICVYGDSGTCKTSLLGTFLTGMHRANGKKARLYNNDGGVDSIDYHRIAGRLDVVEMGAYPFPFEVLLDMSRGYWPVDPADPASPLIAPTLVRWVAHCEPCDTRAFDQDKASQLTAPCPKCKAVLPVRPRQVYNPANDLKGKNIGALLYEGMTGFAERFMDRMSEVYANDQGKIGGETPVKFKDGQLGIGGTTQSAYGIAQRRVKSAVDNTRLIPAVDYVLWTAHKDRGEDNRRPVFGPRTVGTAAISEAPRWFGQCFAVTNWLLKDGKVERRVYLQNYREDFNPITKDIEHICNSRVPPHVMNGLAPYYVFDAEKKGPFGAETLLWDIIALIESKQNDAAKRAVAEK